MPKPLSEIVARLQRKEQGQAITPALTPSSLPLADLLAEGLPEPTEWELEQAEAELAALLQPATAPGPDPRKPWIGKGRMDQPGAVPVQERIALNNAIARAKVGKRLTLKERRLLGKHNLAKIIARLRPRSGDVG